MHSMSAERRDVIAYPTNRVVGSLADAGQARAAIASLLKAGFEQEDIDILHGEEDLERLDRASADHGFLSQFRRTLVRAFEFDEFRHLAHHIEDVRAGRYVVMVHAKRRTQRIAAADILHQYGAEFVGFYGRWAWEGLPPSAQTTPEQIPALFVRAWNDRNLDALASLFDEDAEFVNVAGLCWHNRESIRKGHAARLDAATDKSTLASADTKVKLLSPEIAVVHTRMTRSGDGAAPADGAGSRGTIVSFVVHRAGDRWLCASAHNTDVRGDAPLSAGQAGMLGAPH